MNDEVLELDQAQIYTHRYTQNCVCADIMERVVRIGTESLVAYEVFADSDPHNIRSFANYLCPSTK